MQVTQDTIRYIKDCVDPMILLESLGFSSFIKTNKEIRCPCAIHGGDNATGFRFRTDKKTFVCFTRGCHLNDSGGTENDLISLVKKVKHIGFLDAVKFLCNLFNINLDDISNPSDVTSAEFRDRHREHALNEFISETEKFVNAKKNLPAADEELILGYKKDRYDYFTRLGISCDIQDYFDVGTYIDDSGYERMSIPIRDVTGRVVSISGRIVDSCVEPRYKLTKDFDKKRVMYNIHNAVKVRDKFKQTVVIVEGFKAAWAVHNCGFSNVVACMGAMLLEEQVRLLAECGFINCIIMLDGDAAGKKFLPNSINTAKRYMKTFFIDLSEDFPGLSPDDFDCPDLFTLINSVYSRI